MFLKGGHIMSDYRLNFGGIIGPSDTDKLYDMLDIVGPEDELTIIMDAGDTPQGETVFKVLETNEFEFNTKGGHESGKYHIVAKRKG
jgi:hypothetical protein